MGGRPASFSDAFDWSQTPLGPVEHWSEELTQAVRRATAGTTVPCDLVPATPTPAAVLDALFTSAPLGLAIWDRDFRFVRVNDSLAEMNGLAAEAHIGRSLTDLLPDIAGIDGLLDSWRRMLDTGVALLNVEVEGATPALGGHRTWNEHFFPIRLDEEIVGIGAVVEEITERKRMENALSASETRFREFAEASSDILWLRNTETAAFEFLSKSLRTLLQPSDGSGDEGAPQFDWLNAILPEDRDAAFAELVQVREGKRVTHSFRVRLPGRSRVRWIKNTAFPLTDPDGIVRRIGGIAQDVTEEQETDQRLRLLIGELQHRTRNLMGVVQAIAESTLEASTDLAAFGVTFGNRIGALSRAQNLLSRLEGLERISFDELLRTELNAFGALPADDDRVTLDGPPNIPLRSSTIQTLALALHELTTNALKHGALSQPAGRLSVQWQRREAEDAGGDARADGKGTRLVVVWRESNVAMPSRRGADRRGDGRELIEFGLTHQLGAEVDYDLTDDGVACIVTLPLACASATIAGPGPALAHAAS